MYEEEKVLCPIVSTVQCQMTSYDDEYIQFIDEDGNPGEIEIPTKPADFGKELCSAFDVACKNGQSVIISITQIMQRRSITSYEIE